MEKKQVCFSKIDSDLNLQIDNIIKELHLIKKSLNAYEYLKKMLNIAPEKDIYISDVIASLKLIIQKVKPEYFILYLDDYINPDDIDKFIVAFNEAVTKLEEKQQMGENEFSLFELFDKSKNIKIKKKLFDEIIALCGKNNPNFKKLIHWSNSEHIFETKEEKENFENMKTLLINELIECGSVSEIKDFFQEKKKCNSLKEYSLFDRLVSIVTGEKLLVEIKDIREIALLFKKSEWATRAYELLLIRLKYTTKQIENEKSKIKTRILEKNNN